MWPETTWENNSRWNVGVRMWWTTPMIVIVAVSGLDAATRSCQGAETLQATKVGDTIPQLTPCVIIKPENRQATAIRDRDTERRVQSFENAANAGS
jgi:hypothetical protein